MKVDLILNEYTCPDGSVNMVVFLKTPKGIECPLSRVFKNDKLLFKLKCEIAETQANSNKLPS